MCGGQSDTGCGCGLAAVNIPLLSGPRPVTSAKLAADSEAEVPGSGEPPGERGPVRVESSCRGRRRRKGRTV